MKVSIVMPIYNIGNKQRQFRTAVRSLLAQSHKDIEVVIVNDGSPDGVSLDIAHKMAATDARISVIDQANAGVERARRNGLEHVKGEFIMHMDQDDYYYPQAIETLLANQQATQADVVVGQSRRFYLSPRFTWGSTHTPYPTDKSYSRSEFMEQIYISYFGINHFSPTLWNKLYDRRLLERAPSVPLIGGTSEDLNYNMHLLPHANNISILSQVTHLWRWGGQTNTLTNYNFDEALEVYRRKMALIEKFGLNDSFSKFTCIELMNVCHCYFYSLYSKQTPQRDLEATILQTLSLPECEFAREFLKSQEGYSDIIRHEIDNDVAAIYRFLVTQWQSKRLRRIAATMLHHVPQL